MTCLVNHWHGRPSFLGQLDREDLRATAGAKYTASTNDTTRSAWLVIRILSDCAGLEQQLTNKFIEELNLLWLEANPGALPSHCHTQATMKI